MALTGRLDRFCCMGPSRMRGVARVEERVTSAAGPNAWPWRLAAPLAASCFAVVLMAIPGYSTAQPSAEPVATPPVPTPGEPAEPIGCFPPCRPGYLCYAGRCIEACNPPCRADEFCTHLGTCERRTPAAPPAPPPSAWTPPPPTPSPAGRGPAPPPAYEVVGREEEQEPARRGGVLVNPLEIILSLTAQDFGSFTINFLWATGSRMLAVDISPYFAWLNVSLGSNYYGETVRMEGYGGGVGLGLRMTFLTDAGLDGLYVTPRVPLGYTDVSLSCEGGSCGEGASVGYGGFHTGFDVEIGWAWIWSGFMLQLGASLGYGYFTDGGHYFMWNGILSLGYAW